MPRRFNYTDRKKINRDDISIRIQRGGEGLIFDAEIRLADYKLDGISPPPQVFVEACRGASSLWKRFDFGRLGTIQPPLDRSLDEFGVPEGILFRVKVSAADEDSLGRLVAEADAVQPRLPDEQDSFGLPLIQHVAADDIGDEVWRVTDFDGSLPLLKVNSRVSMGVHQFLQNAQNRAMIMPAVMRQVLARILIIDRDGYDDEDNSSWQVRWLRFASNLPGVPAAPEPKESERSLSNQDELEAWIDLAVEAFSARANLFSSFTEPVAMEENP